MQLKYLPLLLLINCTQVEYVEVPVIYTQTDTVEVCNQWSSYCGIVDFDIDVNEGWVCFDAYPDSLEQYMYYYWRVWSMWTGEIFYLYEWDDCAFIRYHANGEGWRVALQVSMDGDPIGQVDCGAGTVKVFVPYE